MAGQHDDDCDDDEMLRDVTPEEMTYFMNNSTRYVSKVFIDEEHYEKIHQTLCSKWDRLHSLSAAMKLMEQYDVKLDKKDTEKLDTMDEVQQISYLVSKMPQQNNEQFQQFFLQLQLLVSTAMRVRQSLEAGRPDEVAAALEDADTTGISQYILRVAIVQAGSEVRELKTQLEEYTQEADNKMGRLLRGQQDNITAQKKLTEAESELARQNGEQNGKAAKAVINFCRGNDKALAQLTFQGWQQAAKHQRLESLLRLEYADRLKDLEDNLAKWKAGQASATQNVMLRQIQQENGALLGRIYDIWRKDLEEAKFMKEHGESLNALNEKMANMQTSQKANATKVLSGMASASESGLVDLVFKNWVQMRVDTLKQKEAHEARLASDSKLDQFTKGKSDEAKYLVQSFNNASDKGLMNSVVSAWIKLYDESRKEAEMAEEIEKSQMKAGNHKSRNKKSAGSVMNKGAQHLVNMLLLRVYYAWRLDSRMEHTLKLHHGKIDGKRQQLVGVQQMFRNFASQLEGGISTGKEPGKDSSRMFDNNNSKVERHRSAKGRREDGSRSLPELKGSGRAAASGSKPPRSAEAADGSPPPARGQQAWS